MMPTHITEYLRDYFADVYGVSAIEIEVAVDQNGDCFVEIVKLATIGQISVEVELVKP